MQSILPCSQNDLPKKVNEILNIPCLSSLDEFSFANRIKFNLQMLTFKLILIWTLKLPRLVFYHSSGHLTLPQVSPFPHFPFSLAKWFPAWDHRWAGGRSMGAMVSL